jgi:hypothetical protein
MTEWAEKFILIAAVYIIGFLRGQSFEKRDKSKSGQKL